MLDSFASWTGHELMERLGSHRDQAESLYHAPMVVLSHDAQADPRFIYANQTALTLWERSWSAFIGMPSRLSAQPMERDARQRLLDRTAQCGYVDDYQGVRITSTGRRFLIERAIIWNVVDKAGMPCGQAASFSRWTWI